jgi:phosphopantetheinyl transferase
MSNKIHREPGGFASSLSEAQASEAVAWAVAIQCAAASDEQYVLRWLRDPDDHDLSGGLGPREVALWMATVSDRRDDNAFDREPLGLERAAALLDKHERDRLSRFVHDDDRRSFAAAHGGARLLLGRALTQRPDALRFAPSAHGKPMLVSGGSAAEFSLSHARGTVAVTAARVPVGVDVEPLRQLDQMESMSDLILTAEEQAVLWRTPKALRSRLFLRYWTLKEALLKAAALGLTIAPNKIAVDAGHAPAVLSAPSALGTAVRWQFIAPALDRQLADCLNA